MSEPFLGQIEVFGFNFPPRRWAQCFGQLMAINQNQALFALLGTTFGGNGTTTFGLPDMRSRIPLGMGTDRGGTAWVWGQKGGTESITLTSAQMAAHTHTVMASSNTTTTGNTQIPNNTVGLGQTSGQTAGGDPLTVNAYVADANPSAVRSCCSTPIWGWPMSTWYWGCSPDITWGM